MAAVFLHGQSGKTLPKLTNPAEAANILTGKQTVTQDGKLLTGTMANNANSTKGGYYRADVYTDIGCAPHDTGANYLQVNTRPNYSGYTDPTTLIKTFIPNLTAAVIRAGQVCGPAGGLQVTGTYTADATAAAGDIVSGKTAYVNGSKLTGTLEKITCVHGVPSILKSYPYTITVELPKSPKMIVFWKYIESDPDVANIQGFFMPELFGTSKMTYRLFSDDEFTSRAITISTSSTSFILSCNQTNNGAAAIWANNYYAVY